MKNSHTRTLRFLGKAQLSSVALALFCSLGAAQDSSEERGSRRPELSDLGRLAIIAADSDRDHAISPQEWERYLAGLGFDANASAALHAPLGRALIHVLDTNTSPGLELADLRSALSTLDLDDDGILMPGELSAPQRAVGDRSESEADRAAKGPGKRILRQAALLVAQAADADKDGAVSRLERVSFLEAAPFNRLGRLDAEAAAGLFLTPGQREHPGVPGNPERRAQAERERRERVDGEKPRGPRGERKGPREAAPEGEQEGKAERPNAFQMLARFLDSDADGVVGQAMLDGIFKRLDLNADGALDRSELSEGRFGKEAGEGLQRRGPRGASEADRGARGKRRASDQAGRDGR